jgi:phenylpyruvate tautomerase
MPFVSITTSAPVDASDQQQAVLTEVTRLVAEHLGKPPSYVMVHLTPGAAMAFAQTAEPCAHVAVHGIGTPTREQGGALVAALCQRLEVLLGVAASRIFIVFTPVPRELWGLGGRLLG